jgi:hypothetical protein
VEAAGSESVVDARSRLPWLLYVPAVLPVGEADVARASA